MVKLLVGLAVGILSLPWAMLGMEKLLGGWWGRYVQWVWELVR